MHSSKILICIALALICVLQGNEANEIEECPAPFVKLNNKCYFAEKEKKVGAFKDNCDELHKYARKVSLDSKEEMQALAQYLNSKGFKEDDQFWTCGDKLSADEVYRWDDLEHKKETYRPVTYNNWLGGKPNVSWNGNCMIVILKNANELMMQSERCAKENLFICELEMQESEVEVFFK